MAGPSPAVLSIKQAGSSRERHLSAAEHRLNLSVHYSLPGWGTDKCTLGPQAKLIHLPSFSSGSEVAAAQRQGKEGERAVLEFLALFILSSAAPDTSRLPPPPLTPLPPPPLTPLPPPSPLHPPPSLPFCNGNSHNTLSPWLEISPRTK